MLWFSLSIITALSVALRDVSVRTYEGLTASDIAVLELLWSLPLLVVVFMIVPRPEIGPGFWLVVCVTLPMNILAYVLYLKSIKVSPISLSVPLLSFTPAFMIVTGFFILGEKVSTAGAAGIVLIVAGSYVLNLEQVSEKGWLAPLVALLFERGPLYMLGTAFLFSFCAVLGKKGILLSSALYFSYLFFILLNLLVVAGIVLFRQTSFKRLRPHNTKGFWLGGLLLVHITCHALAVEMATAAYMVAVKRTSVLFSVLLGWWILKERHMQTRLPGTVLMFAGAVLISIYG